MDSVKEHYERLLARHYTWMFGKTFEEKVAEQRADLEQASEMLGTVARSGPAVDLGCGPGYQSIALAQMGFAPVIAIDSSPSLLDELRAHADNLPIQAVEGDIRHLHQHVALGSMQIAVCMGDTITSSRP